MAVRGKAFEDQEVGPIYEECFEKLRASWKSREGPQIFSEAEGCADSGITKILTLHLFFSSWWMSLQEITLMCLPTIIFHLNFREEFCLTFIHFFEKESEWSHALRNSQPYRLPCLAGAVSSR